MDAVPHVPQRARSASQLFRRADPGGGGRKHLHGAQAARQVACRRASRRAAPPTDRAVSDGAPGGRQEDVGTHRKNACPAGPLARGVEPFIALSKARLKLFETSLMTLIHSSRSRGV